MYCFSSQLGVVSSLKLLKPWQVIQEREVSLAKEKQVQVRVQVPEKNAVLDQIVSRHEENALQDVTKASDVEAMQSAWSLGGQLVKVRLSSRDDM